MIIIPLWTRTIVPDYAHCQARLSAQAADSLVAYLASTYTLVVQQTNPVLRFTAGADAVHRHHAGADTLC